MPDLERWYQAVEALPAKYPEDDVHAAFPTVVDFYLGRLDRAAVVHMFATTTTALVADILDIIQGAFKEAYGGDGPSGAGSTAPLPTGPAPRGAAAARPIPDDQGAAR